MNVLFINPNLGGVSGLNVGLAYVISSVERKHQVRLLDLSFCSKNYLQQITRAVEEGKPDIVAFSITSFTFQNSLRLAEHIKNISPGVSFIFGGVHPTLLPEATIAHPLVDAICIGEGEGSFLEYLDKLNMGKEPDVEGIWHKSRNGHLHKNKLRPFAEKIDNLTFPNWDDWGIEKYLETNLYYLPGALKFLASRGCPYDCSFCSNKAIKEMVPGKYYRVRSVENIIQEVKFNQAKYAQRGFKSIAFGDEIFGLDFEWLKKFCALYKKENLSKQLPWVAATRADAITEKWAATAADAGCKMVMLGIESGDDRIRMQVYKKNITREVILQATSSLRNQGIIFGFYMLAGCPQDSWPSIKASLRLVRETNPAVCHFSFYQPLPETELVSEVKNTMWKKDKDFLGYWNIPRISTFSLSVADLRNIMQLIRISEFLRFLKLGFKLKKMVFIIDIAKYLFLPGNWKKFILMKAHIKSDLQQKTIFRYICETKVGKSPKYCYKEPESGVD